MADGQPLLAAAVAGAGALVVALIKNSLFGEYRSVFATTSLSAFLPTGPFISALATLRIGAQATELAQLQITLQTVAYQHTGSQEVPDVVN